MSSYKVKLPGQKSKTVTGGEFVAALVGIVLAIATIFFGTAWVVMLVMGALHAEVAASIPAISYFGSCVLTFALGLLASFFKRN